MLHGRAHPGQLDNYLRKGFPTEIWNETVRGIVGCRKAIGGLSTTHWRQGTSRRQHSTQHQEGNFMKTCLSVLLLMVLVAGGCKKDEEPTTAPAAQVIPTELVGTWTTQGATLNGVPTPLGVAMSRTKAKWAKLVLLGAGTFSVQQLDSSNMVIYNLEGTAKLDGQKISLEGTTLDGLPCFDYCFMGYGAVWAVSGNQLVTSFYYSMLGGTVAITWTK